jgi:hypothetical protein
MARPPSCNVNHIYFILPQPPAVCKNAFFEAGSRKKCRTMVLRGANVLKTEKNCTVFSKILAGYPLYISDEVSIIKKVQRQLAKSAKEYA